MPSACPGPRWARSTAGSAATAPRTASTTAGSASGSVVVRPSASAEQDAAPVSSYGTGPGQVQHNRVGLLVRGGLKGLVQGHGDRAGGGSQRASDVGGRENGEGGAVAGLQRGDSHVAGLLLTQAARPSPTATLLRKRSAPFCFPSPTATLLRKRSAPFCFPSPTATLLRKRSAPFCFPSPTATLPRKRSAPFLVVLFDLAEDGHDGHKQPGAPECLQDGAHGGAVLGPGRERRAQPGVGRAVVVAEAGVGNVLVRHGHRPYPGMPAGTVRG